MAVVAFFEVPKKFYRRTMHQVCLPEQGDFMAVDLLSNAGFVAEVDNKLVLRIAIADDQVRALRQLEESEEDESVVTIDKLKQQYRGRKYHDRNENGLFWHYPELAGEDEEGNPLARRFCE